MFLHSWITREFWHFTLTAILRLAVCICGYFSWISWCSISFHFIVTTKGRFWHKLLVVIRVCSLVVVNFCRRLCKNKLWLQLYSLWNLRLNQFQVCPFLSGADICWAKKIRLCIPGIEAQRPVYYFSPRPYFSFALARLPRFTHLVKNRQKWLLRMLSTNIPSWSPVMLSILWDALHFDSKELRVFRESSVERKWRKHAIGEIMFV